MVDFFVGFFNILYIPSVMVYYECFKVYFFILILHFSNYNVYYS